MDFFKTENKQCSCYASITKLNSISNETLLYNKWLCFYHHHHLQNLLSIVLFTQEFNFILERIWHPAILQSIFESLFCNYLCEVISLTNVAVIGEINKKISLLIRCSRQHKSASKHMLQSTTHAYMCNNVKAWKWSQFVMETGTSQLHVWWQ